MPGSTRDTSLTLSEALGILRKHWILVLCCVLLAVGGASAFVMLSTPLFRAEASMYISVRSAGPNNPLDLTQGSSYARQAVVSYASVITSPIVLDRVVADLGLEESADALANSIIARSPANSVLIDVSVQRADPEEAAAIANSLTVNFTYVVEEIIEQPEDGSQSAVQVTTIRDARVPEDPVSPATVQSIVLGLILGIILGVAAAFLRTALGTRLRTSAEVRHITEIPVIGEILADPGDDKFALVVHADPHNPKAESFRSLRTSLQFVNANGQPRSFLITSGTTNEGKSTTACNLAIALAQTGVSVALVDGDLRKPTVAHYMGVDPVVGLSNVLVGLLPLDDALQPWRDSRLAVLAAGRVPPNPSELLSSAEMVNLHRTLTSRFDYVIVDSPPVLAVTDAAVISGLTGGTIIVVAAGQSRRAGLLATIAALEGIANHISGIVLTGVSGRGSTTYRYGYGRYRADGPSSPMMATTTRSDTGRSR